jgi:chromosomal replication initiator protein
MMGQHFMHELDPLTASAVAGKRTDFHAHYAALRARMDAAMMAKAMQPRVLEPVGPPPDPRPARLRLGIRIYAAPLIIKFVEPTIPKITARTIIVAVAQEYGVTPGELISDRRFQPIVLYRQIAMYLCKHACWHLSFPAIGRAFGGRDHTTALHAVRKIDRMIKAGELVLPPALAWFASPDRQSYVGDESCSQ